ncbi:hypothetical protein AtNW77_Chr4g0271531 [Arabidopsis thaliana]
MVVFFFANPYITYTHQIQIIDTNYSQIKKVFDIYSPYIYIYIYRKLICRPKLAYKMIKP